MAGFNFEAGRSNNMVEAEERGMVTIGRWAKQYGISARAASEVMQPHEAHHTGTGRRGKSRLTAVIDGDLKVTAAQLAAMQAWDRGERPAVRGWYTVWTADYSGPYGRRRNVATVGIFEGDPAKAPRGLKILDDMEFAKAQPFAGKALRAYATRYDEVKD